MKNYQLSTLHLFMTLTILIMQIYATKLTKHVVNGDSSISVVINRITLQKFKV